MAFYLQFNGSSNATAPTLGNILTSTVKFSQQNAVLQTNDTSYWLAQAAGGNRELGIFTLLGNVSLFAGGAQTSAIISGNEVIAEFGSSLIVSDLFEFEINMNTGEYAFYNNSATPFKTGTAAVGTNRIDGCLFRIGGRGANNTPGSTASSLVPGSQWQAGNTYVTVDGILERSFESTGVDSNWDDITNNQDATVQGATLPADWVFYEAPSAGGGVTGSITELAQPFTDLISATLTGSISATVAETAGVFSSSINASLTPAGASVFASINESAFAFSDFVSASVTGNNSATVSEIAGVFSDSISASIAFAKFASISESNAAFSDSIVTAISISIDGSIIESNTAFTDAIRAKTPDKWVDVLPSDNEWVASTVTTNTWINLT